MLLFDDIFVGELRLHKEPRGISPALLLALLPGVLGHVQRGVLECQLHRLGIVLYRGDVLENFFKAADVRGLKGSVLFILLHLFLPPLVAYEPVEGLGLHIQKVGKLYRLLYRGEVQALGGLVQGHQGAFVFGRVGFFSSQIANPRKSG